MPNYDQIGLRYRTHRNPDPRIAAQIEAALGDATTVVNVGAGSGSYESLDRHVVAIEPSPVMIAQRPVGSAPCVRGVAGSLPFADGTFDAAMAMLTVHHWPDSAAGLAELVRVSWRQVVFCFDFDATSAAWLVSEYLPEIADQGWARWPTPSQIAAWLGGQVRVEPILVPADCTDGFQNAYWRRPEAYLDADVRACVSSLAVLDEAVLARGLRALEADLASGAWHERHADLLPLAVADCGYRLVVADQRPARLLGGTKRQLAGT
jgi:SAM-dependent methyltransferase